jgi:diaminohydroxyphosphoribosylaminopyrimidine deaminase/5-amino-6-(5-phosphoribosylamino)uracil reductase
LARRRGATVALDAVDAIFLRRAYELARRGRGSTLPNPCVGAVIARRTETLGEGFHRARGSAHAEVEALASARAAGNAVDGATLYVSLEPCAHRGLTPPCTDAILENGIARVVIGTHDPDRTAAGGADRLRGAGIAVDVADDAVAQELIEDFAVAANTTRPYLTLKMAASLDGFVGAKPGSTWLSGEGARAYVRELRIAHDAVLVGAGTIRADDSLLTVRPPHARRKPYVRIVACGSKVVAPDARVFAPVEGYGRTIVLAPAGRRKRFSELEGVADVTYFGDEKTTWHDPSRALAELKKLGISSVLCEGGPMLAAALLENGLVDRIHWIVTPHLLANDDAQPVLKRASLAEKIAPFQFDRVERLGDDVVLSARLSAPAGEKIACSPD